MAPNVLNSFFFPLIPIKPNLLFVNTIVSGFTTLADNSVSIAPVSIINSTGLVAMDNSNFMRISLPCVSNFLFIKIGLTLFRPLKGHPNTPPPISNGKIVCLGHFTDFSFPNDFVGELILLPMIVSAQLLAF